MIQVRKYTYRGKDGYHICGDNGIHSGISIFTLTRESADHIAAKVRQGLDIDLADFQVRLEATPGNLSGEKR